MIVSLIQMLRLLVLLSYIFFLNTNVKIELVCCIGGGG